MEVMALPSKETMQFYTEIYPWVKSSYPDDETPRFVFQEDTPSHILETFNRIKGKLGYEYAR
jgi:hypothetical protein|nr:MAG TPA: hypothetical protein [Caudoviricetes sp.]DAR75652.1 MAG TPA: hypothetical protein [Bacteriophage sp.]